ncbi:MAG: hypothetical protein ONA90_08325 [candidate division KSB1 bacterium]|nr:hypothetical protein [candidate division KSB1 bacterium]
MKRILFAVALIALSYYLYRLYTSVSPLDRADIKEKFIAGIPTIFRAPGGNLELAAFQATETFTSSSTAVLPYFDWKIPGTTTFVEIKVPVTYRYHVQLRDPWAIEVEDNTCLIVAPLLRPTLPPAIHTEGMEILTIEGPLAWDGEAQKETLLKSLTPKLEISAADSSRVKLVREEARKTVAEFVQTWLLQRGDWGERKIEHIKVLFADEKNVSPDSLMPAAEYESQ